MNNTNKCIVLATYAVLPVAAVARWVADPETAAI